MVSSPQSSSLELRDELGSMCGNPYPGGRALVILNPRRLLLKVEAGQQMSNHSIPLGVVGARSRVQNKVQAAEQYVVLIPLQ